MGPIIEEDSNISSKLILTNKDKENEEVNVAKMPSFLTNQAKIN